MSDLRDKLLDVIKSNSEYEQHEKRVSTELDYISDNNMLEDFYVLYQSVIKHKIIGNNNKVNSVVAYLLNITSAKPDYSRSMQVKKRRTYGRAGFPDIDMDFDYLRRNEIVKYIVDKYGKEYVANIGVVQRLKSKASVRRAVKVLDPANSIHFDERGKKIKSSSDNFSFALENEILKTLPGLMKHPDGTYVKDIAEAFDEYPEFKKHMKAYPEVYRVSQRIEGNISSYGCHAAGMVISPVPLEEICPLHMTTGIDLDYKDKVVATQFSMYDVESLGLIKFDILGLSTKTAISWAVELVEENHGLKIDISRLPLDDKKTLDLLNTGMTDGVFQLENTGMKQTLQQISMDSFDDLVVAVAMYRPGPKDYIPEYAARKNGSKRVTYAHPLIKEITEETYGILVFQEQVMKAFMVLADLTASEGYKFMKGCAKKKQELILEPKDRFLKGAVNKGVDSRTSNAIWSDMEKFGGYAFNKAHAASYAYESFKTAYLKAHFPLEFMCARLSVETIRRKFDDIEKYENDTINNLKIRILKPDINKSKMRYTIVDDKTLRRSILIKGIGHKAAEDIVSHQPYKGPDVLYSFASKVGAAVSVRTMDAMYDAGLWPDIKKSIAMSDFDRIKKDKRLSKGRQTGDMFA